MSHQVCFTFEIYPLIIGQSKKVKNDTLKYHAWEKVFCDSEHVTTFRIVLEKMLQFCLQLKCFIQILW